MRLGVTRLKRSRFRTLVGATALALAVLHGGTATAAGLKQLHRLHDDLMARWASPGGSADLLGVTLFLDRLETGARPVSSQQEHLHGNTEFQV